MDSTHIYILYPSIRELILKLVNWDFILTVGLVFSMTSRAQFIKLALSLVLSSIPFCVNSPIRGAILSRVTLPSLAKAFNATKRVSTCLP